MKKLNTFLKVHYRELVLLIGILAVYLSISIFWLLMRGEVSDDEFYTLRDTFGVFYAERQLKWDFYRNMITNEPTTKQLDFLLLAMWMRLFGTSPIIMRIHSLLYGVLSVLSFFYIAQKTTKKQNWAFWAGLLFAVDPIFVELSVNIRGYTLLIFLNIWIFYWIYSALNTENTKQICLYGIAATLFSYAAYRIRVFELLYLSGIVIYIVVKAIRTREKKAVFLSKIVVGSSLLIVVLIFLKLDEYIPLFAIIKNQLESYAVIGWNNPQYIRDLMEIFIVYPVTAIGLLFSIVGILKKNLFENDQKDFIIYELSIVLGTMFWFLCAIGWMYDAKYLLAIHPAMILLVTGGICAWVDVRAEKTKGIIYGVLLCCIAINLYGSGMRAMNYSDEDFTGAYQKVAEYIKDAGMKTPVFFTGGEIREYYARDIFGEHTSLIMPSKDDDLADHITTLSAIGREHPEGIIVEENRGIGGLSYYFQLLLKTDAFEQITGDGIDESKIGSWAYHIENLREGRIDGKKTSIRFGYNYGGSICITEEKGKTILELEINGSAPEKTLLCIKVNQFYAGESRKRYIQLVLEPNERERQYYRIELQNEEEIEKSLLDETYYIYENGKEPRRYMDCYTF